MEKKNTGIEARKKTGQSKVQKKTSAAINPFLCRPSVTYLAGVCVRFFHQWVNPQCQTYCIFQINDELCILKDLQYKQIQWNMKILKHIFYHIITVTHSAHIWQCHLRIHWSGTHWDNFSLFTQMGKWVDMHGWLYSSNWACEHLPGSHEEWICAKWRLFIIFFILVNVFNVMR